MQLRQASGPNEALNSKGLRPIRFYVSNMILICPNEALNSKGLRQIKPSRLLNKSIGPNEALNSKGLRRRRRSGFAAHRVQMKP